MRVKCNAFEAQHIAETNSPSVCSGNAKDFDSHNALGLCNEERGCEVFSFHLRFKNFSFRYYFL